LPSRPEPLRLERSDAGLLLLERVRDEAHRWANSRHRRARSRRSLASSLTAIPGIGPKRKRQLLRVFGSLEGVRQASLEELSRVLGRALGRRVKEAFQEDCYDNTASG
jgi:excinuclease ABC subunit C